MEATIQQSTVHVIDAESKEGKSFLRRVIRDGDWKASASPSTGWQLHFDRTIRGAVGESDAYVTVATNVQIARSGKTGAVKSFADSDEVQVCTPRRVGLSSSDVTALAILLLDGARLTAHSSSGSTSSSRIGLSFYSLTASLAKAPYADVQIGGQTIAKDGKTIVCGAVDIY